MTTHTPIKAIFFDLDGTLLDTSPDFLWIINEMLTKDGHSPMVGETIDQFISSGARRLLEQVYPTDNESLPLDTLHKQFLSHYEQRIQQTNRKRPSQYYEGIELLLNTLIDQGIHWGIVTNKPETLTTSLLQQYPTLLKSDVTICPEHVTNAKPDPEGLHLACTTIGVEPQSCIYIGDHERDITAGKRAGMTTVGALYGYIEPNEKPERWQADYNVQSAMDLLPWLNKIHWQIPRRTSVHV